VWLHPLYAIPYSSSLGPVHSAVAMDCCASILLSDFNLLVNCYLTSTSCAGLLNTENREFVAELVALAQRELSAAVAAPDRHKARMLLRLFAALVVANVLHPSSVVAGLQQVVDTAVAVVEGGAASTGLSPAPLGRALTCLG